MCCLRKKQEFDSVRYDMAYMVDTNSTNQYTSTLPDLNPQNSPDTSILPGKMSSVPCTIKLCKPCPVFPVFQISHHSNNRLCYCYVQILDVHPLNDKGGGENCSMIVPSFIKSNSSFCLSFC